MSPSQDSCRSQVSSVWYVLGRRLVRVHLKYTKDAYQAVAVCSHRPRKGFSVRARLCRTYSEKNQWESIRNMMGVCLRSRPRGVSFRVVSFGPLRD